MQRLRFSLCGVALTPNNSFERRLFSSSAARHDSNKRYRHLNRLTPENAVNPLTKPLQMDLAALHVVSTPIGNIKDFTIRALEILRQCDYIVCTNRNATKALLEVVDIDYAGRLIHYGPHEESSRVEAGAKGTSSSAARLVDLLKGGRSMALVAPSGTPGVGDAGNDLIREMLRSGIRVSAVPGASSIIAGLTTSGSSIDNPAFDTLKGCPTAFPSGSFFFGGQLSEQSGPRARQLRQIQFFSCPVVFYESPKRLLATLGDMLSILGTRESYTNAGSFPTDPSPNNTHDNEGDLGILLAGKGGWRNDTDGRRRNAGSMMGKMSDVPRRVSISHEMTKFHESSHSGPIIEMYRYYGNLAGSKGLELGQVVVVVDGLDAELLEEFRGGLTVDSGPRGILPTPAHKAHLEHRNDILQRRTADPTHRSSQRQLAEVEEDCDAFAAPISKERRRELRRWLVQRRQAKRQRLLRAIVREQALLANGAHNGDGE